MINYIELVGEYYSGVGATCNGDTSIYENLVWDDTIISKADLDIKYLECRKLNKNEAIDKRTVELINGGFIFDSNTFSLSEPAQLNWVGMKTLEALMSFPSDITTKDDGLYSLTQANLDPFIGTAMATKQAHLDSGRLLKISINAATTIEEIDAIEDNR